MGYFSELALRLQRGEDITAEPCPRCAHPMRNGYCFYCGTGQRPPGKTAEQRARDEERALELWDEALPIPGTLAEHYLRHHRRIDILPPAVDDVLRFHPRCPFRRQLYVPALVALLRNVLDGHACGLHRTPIDRTMGKVESPRTFGTLGHAAIKLWPAPEQGRLLVGEGIETTLAAVQLLPQLKPAWQPAPAWALGAANNLGNFPVVDTISELHIAVDNDKSCTGQRNAAACAARYRAAGKVVFTHTPRHHKDFNDILREQRRG